MTRGSLQESSWSSLRFSGVIDFALDPRVGDDIQIVYQENFLDDQKFSDGPILAASFNNNGRLVEAFRYTDSQGDVGYFDADGVSMRKAFLACASRLYPGKF